MPARHPAAARRCPECRECRECEGAVINRLIEFSARNAFLVVLLILAIVGAGSWAVRNTPIDAIPDLSDVQVIIMTDWEGRSPTLVEDQVTYPIVTSLISAPRVKVVRGFSYFD